jgi:hypothetical protein
MNHRLDGRLRKLEQAHAAELDRDREIRIMWVTANSSRGPGLWLESELSAEERTSMNSLVTQPPPIVAVGRTEIDAGPTCAAEEVEQGEP